MKKNLVCLALSLLTLREARAFCGFYIAKADASLFNKASQVVLVRDENKTALTMFSDYQGEMKDFALVVPVPEVLTKDQINVGDKSLLEKIDAFSAPRLVEYFDPDPCAPIMLYRNNARMSQEGAPLGAKPASASDGALGVKIEARYTVGEYDIILLSAKESGGLETWLNQNGYKLPKGASAALAPYIKTGMKFFVAKVNLAEQVKTGFTFLRPLQFAYESPKFMLPIRLGMVNADGPQDMLIYAITRKGRVETTNYRTVKIPSEQEIPRFIKEQGKFADFYKDMFETALAKDGKKVVIQEYAWNMGWCDPCAANPLKPEELKKLGVFWLTDGPDQGMAGRGGAVDAFVTRLHVRYDRQHFPEDLVFQTTSDSANFQGRYIINQPFVGAMSCPAASAYPAKLKDRNQREAKNLAMLTGWKMTDIVAQISKQTGKDAVENTPPGKKWYQGIFK